MQFRKLGLAIAVVVTSASTSQGQNINQDSVDYCHLGELLPERLIGDDYTITVSKFLVLTNETPTYVGQAGSMTVTIDYDGGEFLLIGMPPPIPTIHLSQADVGDQAWTWEADVNLNTHLSREELEITAGCDIVDLPRLQGYFETTSQDGHPISHTMRFVALQEGLLIGFWSWDGGADGAEIKRRGGIQLTRP